MVLVNADTGPFRSWLDGFAGAGFTVDRHPARMRLISNTPAAGAALVDALGQTFDAGQLAELRDAAVAGPAAVAGRGPYAARGMHGEGWHLLAAALAEALHRARHPAQTICVGDREPQQYPVYAYQVFVAGGADPIEVLVKPRDGRDPYPSTIVEPDCDFEFITSCGFEDDAVPLLQLVPLRRLPTQEETP